MTTEEDEPLTRTVTVRAGDHAALSRFKDLFPEPEEIVAMKVNGRTVSLTSKLNRRCSIDLTPVYQRSVAGEALLRRSCVFLLALAIHQLNPDANRNWQVLHQLDSAYFCSFEDMEPVTEEYLAQVQQRMLDLASQELEIRTEKLYYRDALALFRGMNMTYTVAMIEHMNRYEVDVHSCEGFAQVCHRVLIHNTRYLTGFTLHKRGHGWALIFKFSKWREFYQPAVMSDERVIEIHQMRSSFNKDVGVECVGHMNRLILDKQIEDFIQLNNTFQDMVMSMMIRKIKQKGPRLILIAGPSASGKTTFAWKLCNNLKCHGIRTYTISVDNYFVPRLETPIDPETGKYDFECLEAVRIPKLNEDLTRLLAGEEIWLPEFDFKTGVPNDEGSRLRMEEGSFLIMEGIHCLNDALTRDVPAAQKYKIFIAPFTPITLDDRNYISNKVIRLLRRMVRDMMHRSHGVHATLTWWNAVMKGEHKYIFPFMKDADFIFNSALDYEINVLKPYALLQLNKVRPNEPEFAMASELLEFLSHFEILPYKYVPRDSLLQEFLKGHWLN